MGVVAFELGDTPRAPRGRAGNVADVEKLNGPGEVTDPMSSHSKFATWVFRGAGVYGVLLIGPMYFMEPVLVAQGQPLSHPEHFYGFVGITLSFQLMFLAMSRDIVRHRSLIPVCIVEKVLFPAAVWPLFLAGRTPGIVAAFATIDVLLALLFAISWVRTRPAP